MSESTSAVVLNFSDETFEAVGLVLGDGNASTLSQAILSIAISVGLTVDTTGMNDPDKPYFSAEKNLELAMPYVLGVFGDCPPTDGEGRTIRLLGQGSD